MKVFGLKWPRLVIRKRLDKHHEKGCVSRQSLESSAPADAKMGGHQYASGLGKQ